LWQTGNNNIVSHGVPPFFGVWVYIIGGTPFSLLTQIMIRYLLVILSLTQSKSNAILRM